MHRVRSLAGAPTHPRPDRRPQADLRYRAAGFELAPDMPVLDALMWVDPTQLPRLPI